MDDYATTNRTFTVAVSARSFSFLSALADRHVGPLRISLAIRSLPALASIHSGAVLQSAGCVAKRSFQRNEMMNKSLCVALLRPLPFQMQAHAGMSSGIS